MWVGAWAIPRKGKQGQLHQDQRPGGADREAGNWRLAVEIELLPVSPWNATAGILPLSSPTVSLSTFRYLLSLPGTYAQKHFFPRAVLPIVNAPVLLITSTLHILMNQFCPSACFRWGISLFPLLCSFRAVALNGGQLVWIFQNRKEEPL